MGEIMIRRRQQLVDHYQRQLDLLNYGVVCGVGFMLGLLLNFLGVFQ